MSKPVVSVVVPLYNKRPYILRCLKSIQAQTMPQFEVLVVDDGSTDGSHSAAAAFEDERFHVVRQTNQGVGPARNRGIEQAASDLIAFVDADDEWDPGFLEAIVALTNRHPSAGLFATGFRRCYGGTKPDRQTTLRVHGHQTTELITDYFRCACDEDFVTASSAAVKRCIFDGVGLFPLKPVGEDKDLWARIAARYPIAYDTRVLATYHLEAQGRSIERWISDLPYPPLISTLRNLLAEGGVTTTSEQNVRTYVDCVLAGYIHGLIGLQLMSTAWRVLNEETFLTPRYQIEAAALRWAMRRLPPRIITAFHDRRMRCAAHLRILRFAFQTRLRAQTGALPVTTRWSPASS